MNDATNRLDAVASALHLTIFRTSPGVRYAIFPGSTMGFIHALEAAEVGHECDLGPASGFGVTILGLVVELGGGLGGVVIREPAAHGEPEAAGMTPEERSQVLATWEASKWTREGLDRLAEALAGASGAGVPATEPGILAGLTCSNATTIAPAFGRVELDRMLALMRDRRPGDSPVKLYRGTLEEFLADLARQGVRIESARPVSLPFPMDGLRVVDRPELKCVLVGTDAAFRRLERGPAGGHAADWLVLDEMVGLDPVLAEPAP